MILRSQSERVTVDSFGGGIGMMLVRLHVVEVPSIPFAESVLSVKTEQGSCDGILTINIDMLVSVIRIVEVFVVGRVRIVVTTDKPDEFLDCVVERQLDSRIRTRHGFLALELHLLDQILVRELGELLSLIRIKVHIVDP